MCDEKRTDIYYPDYNMWRGLVFLDQLIIQHDEQIIAWWFGLLLAEVILFVVVNFG